MMRGRLVMWRGDGVSYRKKHHYWIVVSRTETAFAGPTVFGDVPLFLVPMNTHRKGMHLEPSDVQVGKGSDLPSPLKDNNTPSLIRCGQLQSCRHREELTYDQEFALVDEAVMDAIDEKLVQVFQLDDYVKKQLERALQTRT